MPTFNARQHRIYPGGIGGTIRFNVLIWTAQENVGGGALTRHIPGAATLHSVDRVTMERIAGATDSRENTTFVYLSSVSPTLQARFTSPMTSICTQKRRRLLRSQHLTSPALAIGRARTLAFGLALAATGLLTLGLPSAQAANDAWSTAPGSANFSGTNWTTGATIPGAATGTAASTDSLYFGTSTTTALNDDDAGFTFAGLTFNSGASTYTIGGNAFTLSGAITNNSTSLQTINDAITLGATENINAASGNVTLGGVISGAAGTYGLNITGDNTVTLTGANTYTGTTAIGIAPSLSGIVNSQVYAGTTTVTGTGGGTLKLDFSAAGAPTTNILSSGSALSMGGATLSLVGAASAANAQTVTGLVLNPGLSTITLTAGSGGGSIVLNLGAITQNGTANLDDRVDGLNINLPSGTQSATNGVTTSNVNTNGIIKATNGASFSNITVNGTDYAANATNASGGNIIAYTGYDTTNALNSNTANYTITSSPTIASGSANTIRFGDTTAHTITLTTGTLTVSGGSSGSSGGTILMSSASGGITNTITGGTLAGLSNRGLEIFQYDTTSGANLQINSAIGFNGNNTSTQNITLLGGGLVTFGGANFYNGLTSVNGGTLSVGSDQNLGGNNGTVTVTSSSTASASVTVSAVPALSTGFAVGTQLLGQTIINISGTTISLSGNANTAIASSTAVGFASGSGIALNGATLQATGTFSVSETNATTVAPATNNRSIGLGVNGATIDVTGSNILTVPGLIAGSTGSSATNGALNKIDTGTLAITGTTANTNLFLNNMAGTTTLGKTAGGVAATTVTITGGTVQLAVGSSGNQATNLAVNGGTFDLNGVSGTPSSFATLNGTGGTITNNGAANATLYIGNGGGVYNDTLSIASNITDGTSKTSVYDQGNTSSTRVTTLTGTNTYTGTTTVGAGTLLVSGTNSGAGAVTVGAGATLGGIGSLAGATTVNGTITGGTKGSVGTLTTGALTLSSTGIDYADVVSTTSFDQLISTGHVNVNGATLTLAIPGSATFTAAKITLIQGGDTASIGTFANAADGATLTTFGGYNFLADYDTNPGSFDLDIVAVPEPATYLGGLVMLGALGWSRRRTLTGLGRVFSRPARSV